MINGEYDCQNLRNYLNKLCDWSGKWKTELNTVKRKVPKTSAILDNNSSDHHTVREILTHIQRRMTKMINDIMHIPYEERLPQPNLQSLQRHRADGSMIEVYMWCKGIK